MPITTSAVVRLSTRIPYQLRHRADVHRGARDTTLTQLVIDALPQRLETIRHAERRAAAR